tara:strand:+ start:902 stop:1075 length:174 start_codon:yes stop_codon:yes gene_type:complete
MSHKFTIEVFVERVEGKFATRDEMAERIIDAVMDADMSGLGDDGESEYEITECGDAR